MSIAGEARGARVGQVYLPRLLHDAQTTRGTVLRVDEDLVQLEVVSGQYPPWRIWLSYDRLAEEWLLQGASAEKSRCECGADAGRGGRPGAHSRWCPLAGESTIKRSER